MRALIDQAKTLYNPLTLNTFLSKLPQGITLDQNFSLNELISLAEELSRYQRQHHRYLDTADRRGDECGAR